MPYSQYRPDLMGSATLEPSGRLEAGSWQSFKLVYTCGRFGIDDTGSLKIGFRFATDFGPVQFDDPKAPGYTTVEASNGATLETRWEFKRNIRPWSRSLYIGIGMHFLKPGDTVTIRFGDQPSIAFSLVPVIAKGRCTEACRQPALGPGVFFNDFPKPLPEYSRTARARVG